MKSRYVIIAVVIGIIIIAWISFRVSFGTTNPFYVFTANTMAPTLKRGDVLVIRNSNGGAPFSNLKIGDIIVWRQSVNSEGNPSVAVVSRISDIQTNSTK